MIDVKILAGYLPYELQFSGGGDIWTMYSIGAEGDVVLKNGLHVEVINAANVGLEYKPMLRPMNSITQEEYAEYDLQLKGFISGYKNSGLHAHKKIQWFLERHYDIHDLIGQGLAECDYRFMKNPADLDDF